MSLGCCHQAQADVTEELSKQIDLLNAELTKARGELDTKFYGGPLAVQVGNWVPGQENSPILPGQTTLSNLLTRTRAENDAGKREVR